MSLLTSVYLFIPAYVANSAPPLLARFFPRWNQPLDCGLHFRRRQLLGANKTWRGLIGGTLIGGTVFLLMPSALPWWYGTLVAAGALIGDAVESLAKRQSGIPPGRTWFPFDQIDFTIGAFAFTFWMYWPGWTAFFTLLVVNALGTAAVHYAGFRLGLTKDPF